MLARYKELMPTIIFKQSKDAPSLPSLSSEEWKTLDISVKLLRPLFEATNEISRQQYVTGSLTIPMVKTILASYGSQDRISDRTSFHRFDRTYGQCLREEIQKH